jgi:hypothetical protein
MTHRRVAVLALGAGLAVAGAVASRGAPRLTLVNTGIRVEYPRWPAAAGLAIAAGAAIASAAAPRRWLGVALGVAALLAASATAGRLRYRLEAGPQTLAARGLLGETSVPWKDVSRVEDGPEILVVWGAGDTQIRITTTDYLPDQRATLERTIARRVAENAPSASEP